MTRMTGSDCLGTHKNILPPEPSFDMGDIGKVTEWVQERRVEDISLNGRKSQALAADGVGPDHLMEEQRTAMDDTGLTVVLQGARLVGVPVATKHRRF